MLVASHRSTNECSSPARSRNSPVTLPRQEPASWLAGAKALPLGLSRSATFLQCPPPVFRGRAFLRVVGASIIDQSERLLASGEKSRPLDSPTRPRQPSAIHCRLRRRSITAKSDVVDGAHCHITSTLPIAAGL